MGEFARVMGGGEVVQVVLDSGSWRRVIPLRTADGNRPRMRSHA